MNKTELITVMAETSGLSKKDCDAALAAFVATIETALKSGDKVQLVGFGSFEVRERKWSLQSSAEIRSCCPLHYRFDEPVLSVPGTYPYPTHKH